MHEQLKYGSVAEVGDVIRSHDFRPRADVGPCWVEGTVTAKGMTSYGYAAYTIRVERAMWDGRDDPRRVGDEVYCPFEVASLDWEGRIEVVHRAGAEVAAAGTRG